jgi:hypothetical protein
MNTRTRTLVGVALALLASAVAPVFAKPHQTAAGGAVYHATLIDTSPVLRRSSTAPIRIRLDRLTTDFEVRALSNAARRGPAAFREVFFTRAIGRIDIDGRLGDPIYYARRYSDAKGEHLIVVAQRSIDAREHFANRRSVAYPYTVVELDLDAEGQMGSYTFAARLEPQRDGTIDYRSLAFVPGRLMAVRQLNR